MPVDDEDDMPPPMHADEEEVLPSIPSEEDDIPPPMHADEEEVLPSIPSAEDDIPPPMYAREEADKWSQNLQDRASNNKDVISSALEPLIQNLMSGGMSRDEALEAIRSYGQNKDS